eukprot:1950325-Prymnesium_polylepis.1
MASESLNFHQEIHPEEGFWLTTVTKARRIFPSGMASASVHRPRPSAIVALLVLEALGRPAGASAAGRPARVPSSFHKVRRLQAGCSDDTATCLYGSDGDCDDGGDGSLYSYCPLGTDCTDCGV